MVEESFGLAVLVGTPTSQAPPASHSIFFIFFRGKGDEENKKNRVGGSQVLASVGWRSVAAVAVSGCCLLFPSRYLAVAFLARVRLSVAVPSSCPVVAAVRLALARS